jgi:hypothetical protein
MKLPTKANKSKPENEKALDKRKTIKIKLIITIGIS